MDYTTYQVQPVRLDHPPMRVKPQQQEAARSPVPPVKAAGQTRQGHVIRRGLREQIVDELRNDLIAGRLAVGEQLVERQLAARFGVSHAPIREALLQLSQEGLVVSQPHAGVRVAPPASSSVRSLLAPVRFALESFAVRQVAGQLDGEDVESLEAILQLQRQDAERGDVRALAEHDFALHRHLVQCAAEPDIMVPWLTSASRTRLELERESSSTAAAQRHLDQHTALLRDLVAGDAEAAVESLRANLKAEIGIG